MKQILVINGNPDPAPERLSSALATAYQEGAEGKDCKVRRLDVGGLDIPVLRKAADFLTQATDRATTEAQEAFLAANHIVLIYPIWLGSPPALLKAFMEQLSRSEFLLKKKGDGFPAGGLKGRSARVIVTMGMPTLLYRTWFGAHGVKAFNQAILGMAGLSPIRTSYFGAAAIAPPRSGQLVEKVRAMGRRHA